MLLPREGSLGGSIDSRWFGSTQWHGVGGERLAGNMKRLRIYLSSTFKDLKEHRDVVFKALERAGLDVARMETYAAADERPLDLCLRDVAQCDIYVGVYAWRYGYEPPVSHGNPDGRSITELEYRQAESKKLRKLIFLADPETQAAWPDPFKDEITGEGGGGEKLKALRRELGIEKSANFFHTPDELATLVLAAIMRTGLSGRPYNIPSSSPGFVERPALTAAIFESLTGEGGLQHTHTVIQGIGGIGKTVVALAACHLPEITRRFSDGMFWTVLGEKPDLANVLRDLHVAMTGGPAQVTGVDSISQVLAKALAGRRCLIVVDDVWKAEDLRPFLTLEGTQLLVTTRVRNLAEQSIQAEWQEIPVGEMGIEEGITLLGRGLSITATTRDSLGKLADGLGCWPLLLELANSRLLEEHKARRQDLPVCINRIAHLFEKRGVLGFDRRDSKARNSAVERSVAVGLEFLDEALPGTSERAAQISIFPEDAAIPVDVLAELWAMNGLDVEEDVVRPLDNLSILRWDRQTNEVNLHDMIQRALAARLGNAPPVHRTLLARWGDPYRLPHEYAWRWYGWHCMRAGNRDELLHLLLDFNWLRNKLTANGIDGLLSDFERIRNDVGVELLHAACRRSAHALALDKSQLAGQLLARVAAEEPLRTRILAQARSIHGAWLRPLTSSLAAERSIRWLRPIKAESLWRVVFSSNGRWAAHVSHSLPPAPSNIVLWDLVAWQSRGARFRAVDQSSPLALALSNDGRWCLYGDSTGGVHRVGLVEEVWEGRAQRDLSILSLLAISGDGKRALSACRHEPLVAWDIDVDSHEVIRQVSNNKIAALTLDATGGSAVVASEDGSVELFDLWPRRRRCSWRVERAPVAIARSPDNAVIVVATVDGRIEARSPDFPESAIGVFRTEEQPSSVALSADARYVALGTQKGTVEVWHLAEQCRKARYKRAHTHEVECITFSHEGSRIVSADSLQIKEWELETTESDDSGFSSSAAQGQVKVTGDGRYVIAVLENGRLGVWSLRTGKLESTLPHPDRIAFGCAGCGPAEGIALASDAPRVLVWNKQLLCVWDLRAGTRVRSLLVSNAVDAAITPDGCGVVFADGDAIRFWRPYEGSSRQLGTCDPDPPRHVAISPDGKRALSTAGRDISLWCVDGPIQSANDARVKRYGWLGTHDKPSAIAFAGPQKAVVRSGTNSLFMLDLRKGSRTEFGLNGNGPVEPNRAAPLHEGRLFATSSYGGPITIWDLDELRSMTVMDVHSGTVGRVSAFAKRLLLSSPDGVIKVVSLGDQSLLAAFQADKQIVSCDGDERLEWVVGRDESGQMHFFCVESPNVDSATK